MKNILILGCGYIGSMVANYLSPYHSVFVTTTSLEKKIDLEKTFPNVFVYPSGNEDFLQEVLEKMDVIVISVAAKNKDSYESTYLQTAKNLKKALQNRTKKLLILYTSSTSVYGDFEGAGVDETTLLKPETLQAKILAETENILSSLESKNISVCIFRLGEIYGPGKDIYTRVKHLQKGYGSGNPYANMIHAQDITRAIAFGIEHELKGIYNLCDDDVYTRKEMYDLVCTKYDLKKIVFDPTLKSMHAGNKRVLNQKIKKEGFTFLYPHRVWKEE